MYRENHMTSPQPIHLYLKATRVHLDHEMVELSLFVNLYFDVVRIHYDRESFELETTRKLYI